jgi:hypothetical protein
MKKLPEVNVNFEDLYRMLVAPICSKLMLTGIELKVFNHLGEPKSAVAVAEAIGTHSENTRLFLDGLAASDLVVKNNGLYQNTPVQPSPETDMSDEEMRGQFAPLMANNERSGQAQQVAEIVSRLPEFPSFKK